MSLRLTGIGRKAETWAAIAIVVFSAWLAPVCSSLCARPEPTAPAACERCQHGDSAKQRPSSNQDCPKLVCARLESTVQSMKQDISELGAMPHVTAAPLEVVAASGLAWSPHRSLGPGPPVPPSVYTILRS